MKYFKVNLAQTSTNKTDVRKVSNVNGDLIKIVAKATEELSDWDGMYNVDDARKRFE